MSNETKEPNKAKAKNQTPTGRMSTRQADITEEIKSLKTLLESLMEENKDLKEKVMDSLKCTEFISAKFDEYEKLIKNDVLQKLEEISMQNKNLMEKNKNLENQLKEEKNQRIELEEKMYMILNPIEMENRSKNLELHGLPETESENCKQLVIDVLQKVTADKVVVTDCFRFGRKFKDDVKINRPILIKFENKGYRETAFSARRNLEKINDHTLYLNQNLPTNLKILRGKANSKRKEKGYNYIWVKNCNVLVKKSDQSQVIVIKKTSDLDLII